MLRCSCLSRSPPSPLLLLAHPALSCCILFSRPPLSCFSSLLSCALPPRPAHTPQLCSGPPHTCAANGTTLTWMAAQRPVYIRPEDGANVEVRGGHGRPLLVCLAEGVLVNGIKFEQGGGDAGRRGRQAVRCIEVATGHLTLSECTVRSEKGIGLMVTDAGAAVVKRSMLHASGKCGMLAMDGGDVRLEQCAVQDNRMYGVVSQVPLAAAVLCVRTALSRADTGCNAGAERRESGAVGVQCHAEQRGWRAGAPYWRGLQHRWLRRHRKRRDGHRGAGRRAGAHGLAHSMCLGCLGVTALFRVSCPVLSRLVFVSSV